MFGNERFYATIAFRSPSLWSRNSTFCHGVSATPAPLTTQSTVTVAVAVNGTQKNGKELASVGSIICRHVAVTVLHGSCRRFSVTKNKLKQNFKRYSHSVRRAVRTSTTQILLKRRCVRAKHSNGWRVADAFLRRFSVSSKVFRRANELRMHPMGSWQHERSQNVPRNASKFLEKYRERCYDSCAAGV